MPVVMMHGCRSEKWIFEGEAKAELEELEQMWRAQFPSLPDTMQRVLARLIRADWRVQWTEMRVFQMESALEAIPANEWTAEQQKQLQLFYRYHTTADRQFHRNWNLLKQYAAAGREPVREQVEEKKKEEDKPMNAAPVYEETPLHQTVVVNIVDGKTVTRMHPNSEQRLKGGGTDSETKRAIRAFEFPDGVPLEYYWVFPEEPRRRAGARRRTEMSIRQWVELVRKEMANGTGHAEPCALELTRLDAIHKRIEESKS